MRLDSTDSMTQKRIEPATSQPTAPTILVSWLAVFRPCFTAPVWNHVLVLVVGAVLAPGKRTVTQALRVMGLADKPGFGRYHEVLNRARWDARDVARRLLLHLLAVLSPSGEVVIGIDDTIERRWGGKIKARGIYRDAARSSHGHFVKTSGLRWLSLAAMLPVPFAGQRWALPFLTVLAPSARWSEAQGRRHKALTDWAKQAILQTKRWLPDRRVVVVADSGFAALQLIAAVRRHVCFITRLRLDASLFEPAAERQKGQIGRPALKGKRRPKLNAVLGNPKTVWTSIMLTEWYGGQTRKLEYVCETAVWYHTACLRLRSVGCWCVIHPACVPRRRFCAPTSTSNLPRSSSASCPAGGSRRPSKRHGNIWASRPSGNGRTWPSYAPHRRCSDSTRWSPSGRMD
jgi:hypothetical protein